MNDCEDEITVLHLVEGKISAPILATT